MIGISIGAGDIRRAKKAGLDGGRMRGLPDRSGGDHRRNPARNLGGTVQQRSGGAGSRIQLSSHCRPFLHIAGELASPLFRLPGCEENVFPDACRYGSLLDCGLWRVRDGFFFRRESRFNIHFHQPGHAGSGYRRCRRRQMDGLALTGSKEDLSKLQMIYQRIIEEDVK